MNILASLVRVIFSIIVLLAIACYLQATPSVSLGDFCLFIEPAQLVQMLSGFNAVTVTLVIILLLGILSFTRVLEAAWNIIFCGAILILLAAGLYFIGGPAVALPHALYHNDAVLQFCQLISTCHVPFAIAGLIFIAGWLCASASGRVAITAVISFGLWYGITEFFTYIVHQWAKSADPQMPEALHMVQGSPWIIAAVPGAFFLIYALLMAFFETFITKAPKATQAKSKDEQKDDKKDTEKAALAGKTVDTKPNTEADKKPAEPVAKSQPILKTAAPAPQKKLKLATAAQAATTPKEEPAETKEAKDEKVATQVKKEETKEPVSAQPEEKKETDIPAKDSVKEDKAAAPANESESKDKTSAPATEPAAEEKTAESPKKEDEPSADATTKE